MSGIFGSVSFHSQEMAIVREIKQLTLFFVGLHIELRKLKTSRYETSRSTLTGWLRQITQKSRSAHVAAQFSFLM